MTVHMQATPHEMVGELLSHDSWSREEVLAHQRAQLEVVLRHAVTHSPYYREVLGEAPWERDLTELPVLSKETLMANWDAIVTDDDVRLADMETALADPAYDGTAAPGVHACATSGTTGRRGVFVTSTSEMTLWTAATLRSLARIGVGPGMRVCAIGAPSFVHMSRQLFSRINPGAPAPPVSVLSPIADIAAHLQAVQPDVLVGYPTVYAAAAEEQLQGRLDIRPKIVAVASEVLSDDDAARIGAAWGIEPRQAYPTTEVPMIGSATAADPEILIAEDHVIVEIEDDRVLVTNLVNRLQPLIRYELNDVVTEASLSPGHPYRRIGRIGGRTSEILDLPAAAGGLVRIHPHGLRRAFVKLPEVSTYQLRIGPGGMRALIVPGPGQGPDLLDRVRKALEGELRAAGADVAVTAETVDHVGRNAAGKLQTIVVER